MIKFLGAGNRLQYFIVALPGPSIYLFSGYIQVLKYKWWIMIAIKICNKSFGSSLCTMCSFFITSYGKDIPGEVITSHMPFPLLCRALHNKTLRNNFYGVAAAS